MISTVELNHHKIFSFFQTTAAGATQAATEAATTVAATTADTSGRKKRSYDDSVQQSRSFKNAYIYQFEDESYRSFEFKIKEDEQDRLKRAAVSESPNIIMVFLELQFYRDLDSDYKDLLEQSLKNLTMDLDGVISASNDTSNTK
jgi:spermidine/putrescine-binding protein